MKNDLSIKFTSDFQKQRKAAPREIKEAFIEALVLFTEDASHPALRNHSLKEKFAGYRSIDVTPDWRALFKETSKRGKHLITFHMLGTHKELYS